MLRNVPHKILTTIKHVGTLSLVMHTKHNKFNDIAEFINGIRINATSRNFSLSRRITHTFRNGKPHDNESIPNVILGYGTSYGIYKGTLVMMDKVQLSNKDDIDDQITLTFLTRNKNVLRQFLKEATHKETNHVDVHVSDGEYWTNPIEKSKRSLDTVFINCAIKEDLIASITKFKTNKEWYTSRGIPYKICIVLHGIPGTGKTSLIHAIASTLNMSIRYIAALDQISSLMEYISIEDDIIVIEDIDSLAALDRETEDGKKDKKIIHNLLNLLDGLKTPEGLVIIITTNHIDQLDSALKRAGRVDKMIEITALNEAAMKKMYIAFYGESNENLVDNFINSGYYIKLRTGAELQQLFLTYDAETVLKQMENTNA